MGGDGTVEEVDLIEFMFPTDGVDNSDTSAAPDTITSSSTTKKSSSSPAMGRSKQRGQSVDDVFLRESIAATRAMEIERAFVSTTFSSAHDRSRLDGPVV